MDFKNKISDQLIKKDGTIKDYQKIVKPYTIFWTIGKSGRVTSVTAYSPAAAIKEFKKLINIVVYKHLMIERIV